MKETDTVEFEFVRMPVVTTAIPFLFRFSKPFDTVWSSGEIKMSEWSIPDTRLGQQELLEKFALKEWKRMITENTPEDKFPEEAKWMLKIDKAVVHQNHIVRMS
jgi:hypothetical protein